MAGRGRRWDTTAGLWACDAAGRAAYRPRRATEAWLGGACPPHSRQAGRAAHQVPLHSHAAGGGDDGPCGHRAGLAASKLCHGSALSLESPRAGEGGLQGEGETGGGWAPLQEGWPGPAPLHCMVLAVGGCQGAPGSRVVKARQLRSCRLGPGVSRASPSPHLPAAHSAARQASAVSGPQLQPGRELPRFARFAQLRARRACCNRQAVGGCSGDPAPRLGCCSCCASRTRHERDPPRAFAAHPCKQPVPPASQYNCGVTNGAEPSKIQCWLGGMKSAAGGGASG